MSAPCQHPRMWNAVGERAECPWCRITTLEAERDAALRVGGQYHNAYVSMQAALGKACDEFARNARTILDLRAAEDALSAFVIAVENAGGLVWGPWGPEKGCAGIPSRRWVLACAPTCIELAEVYEQACKAMGREAVRNS